MGEASTLAPPLGEASSLAPPLGEASTVDLFFSFLFSRARACRAMNLLARTTTAKTEQLEQKTARTKTAKAKQLEQKKSVLGSNRRYHYYYYYYYYDTGDGTPNSMFFCSNCFVLAVCVNAGPTPGQSRAKAGPKLGPSRAKAGPKPGQSRAKAGPKGKVRKGLDKVGVSAFRLKALSRAKGGPKPFGARPP